MTPVEEEVEHEQLYFDIEEYLKQRELDKKNGVTALSKAIEKVKKTLKIGK